MVQVVVDQWFKVHLADRESLKDLILQGHSCFIVLLLGMPRGPGVQVAVCAWYCVVSAKTTYQYSIVMKTSSSWMSSNSRKWRNP
jgi:hypothetical protein